MPPIRSARYRKPPPDGFDDIEDILLEFSNKMKDTENAPHEGKKRHEVLWPIFQISHQRMYLTPQPFSPFPQLSGRCTDEYCAHRLKIYLRTLL